MPKKIVKKENAAEVINESGELSRDTKTLITVICLVTVYPVGLILMFAWMKWNKWVKFLVALPVFMLLFVFVIMTLGAGILLFRGGREIPKMYRQIEVIQDEINVSPTGIVTPTKIMLKPTLKVVK